MENKILKFRPMNNFTNYKAFIILIVLLGLTGLSSFGQNAMTGKEFWIGFLKNFYISDTIYVNVTISSEVSTSGVVSIPQLNWSKNFNVNAGGQTVVDIPSSVFPNYGSGSINNSAVKVTANDSVTVYASNSHSVTSDGSFIFPTHSLKAEYFVISYKGYMSHPSEMMVVAVEDNTNVEITPSVATIDGKQKGLPFNVALNAGQAYNLKAASGSDLTGTKVRGIDNCKKFAVFAGALIANIPEDCPYADHIYSQMLPTTHYGNHFFVAPIGNHSYSCRVLASENNTLIEFNGGQSIILNAGQFFTWNKLSVPMEIKADKPAQVAQYLEGMACAGKGDPAMAMIPAFSQRLYKAHLLSANITNITEHYLNIVMKTQFTSQLKRNGQNIGNGFTLWPGNPQYAYKTISLGNQAGLSLLEADSGFVATAYGFGNYNSYFYPAGISGKQDKVDFTHDEVICVGMPANFSATAGNQGSWEWIFPGGIKQYGTNVQNAFSSSGNHTITVNVSENPISCPETFTKEIYVNPGPDIKLVKDTVICENAQVKLQPMGNALNFLWSTGDTTSALIAHNPGVYRLQTSNGNCFRYDTVNIDLLEQPKIELGTDISFCENTKHTIKLNESPYSKIQWSTGETGNEIMVDKQGVYWAEATNKCGSKRDSIMVSLKPAPALKTISDTTILLGTSAVLQTQGGKDYEWTPGHGLSCTDCSSPVAKPEQTTVYYVTSKNEFGCSKTDTVNITVDPELLVFVPNIFSPNGDGKNDVLYVRGKGVNSLHFIIYNRWGEKVFETKEINQGWDGTINGKGIPPAVYVYYLDAILETGKRIVQKGDVTLVK